MWQIRRRRLAEYGISTAAVAAVVALIHPLRLDLGLINVVLILLLVSVLNAALFGWIVGLYASILSNLAFNFFFVPPLYRFTVQEPVNVLALALFLAVAAVTASLLARSRRSAVEAQRRARDTQLLLALNRTIRDQPSPAIPKAICARVVADFQVRSCSLYRRDGDGLELVARVGEQEIALTAIERPAVLQATMRAMSQAEGRFIRLPQAIFLPLAIEAEVLGVLHIHLNEQPLGLEQEALLEVFADEAAVALHRAALVEAAAHADLLQETDRLRSALLSAVSHDLRTPLTSIKTAAANLRSGDVEWSAAARGEFLAAIEGEADRLTRLVANLLDLSRIEAGALRLDLDWNDLEELVRDAAYRQEQGTPGHAVIVEAALSLPLLRFDYVQIGQVVANLLENAAKFSPAGAPITLSVCVEPERVRVSVRDQGTGIPPGERQRIFEPFYRSKRGEATSGSGLGLAICRGIVDAHGGQIWAEGETGAVLTFTLPTAAAGTPSVPVITPEPTETRTDR
jgi:two-component system, OmpR family, sensor histidine kinase KdpD